jgi:hypothetical protein
MIVIEIFYYLTMNNSEQDRFNIDTLIKEYLKQQKHENKITFKLQKFIYGILKLYKLIKVDDLIIYVLFLILSIVLYWCFEEKAYHSNSNDMAQIIVLISLLIMLNSEMFILFSVIYDLQKNIEK